MFDERLLSINPLVLRFFNKGVIIMRISSPMSSLRRMHRERLILLILRSLPLLTRRGRRSRVLCKWASAS